MSKAELYSLYVSLEHTNTPSKTSRVRKNKTLHVSGTSSSRSSSSPPRSKRNSRPSASRGRAPDSALPDPGPPHSSAQPDAAAPSGTALPAASHANIAHHPFSSFPASNPAPAADASVRMPPLAAQAQLPYHLSSTSAPFFSQWPAALTVDAGSGLYQPAMQTNWPPPSFPSTSSYSLPQASGTSASVRLPPPSVTAPIFLPSSSALLSKTQFTLLSATSVPAPPNAIASEPPPVTHNIWSQILAGADIDLSSLLSFLPVAETNRQIDCGNFSVTLKNPAPSSSRILSFSEFTIAFSCYTDVICSVFPHRQRKLNDYLAIVAELALSYGGGHFYTYHKLFSAKCAVCVTQWNQCPYWGTLDPDLHNRVFLGCRNITCTLCRSLAHTTTSCPQVNPAVPACPDTAHHKSTSYVPRSATAHADPDSKGSSRPPFSVAGQVCRNFNGGNALDNIASSFMSVITAAELMPSGMPSLQSCQ